ncbi:hypothetical protein FF38_10820 [Lucilia cuprina]|uniref:Uncharacterized protein n=1 Tax=Lucilia cuprina TaxID=7375 RepID=A0A0L0CQU8_LUCCU|nr:hypothetical protein FF38_10820 [Lucilia cuprina]
MYLRCSSQKNFPTTYCWHKLICTSDASHLIFRYHSLDARLHLHVPFHKGHIGTVNAEQNKSLPPVDEIIPKEKVQSRNSGHHVSVSTVFENNAHIPITNSILKTAEPTIVPMPTSSNDTKTPITLVNNSGALPPAAMNVAPATSSVMPNFSMITSKEGTKNSSQTMAKATNIHNFYRNENI